MGRRGYPPEFRRRVLDLIEAGRRVGGGRGGSRDQRADDRTSHAMVGFDGPTERSSVWPFHGRLLVRPVVVRPCRMSEGIR
jgi:hypothetical protein